MKLFPVSKFPWQMARGRPGRRRARSGSSRCGACRRVDRSLPEPAQASSGGWVASWAASPIARSTSFSNQTVRDIIYTSAGGSSLRVQLSNTFGSAPLQVGAVSVGVVLNGSQLLPGTSRTVTFGGKTSVTIPAGAQEASDPVTFNVQPQTELAVSVYLPDATGGATNRSDAQQNNYIASGNHVSAPLPPRTRARPARGLRRRP